MIIVIMIKLIYKALFKTKTVYIVSVCVCVRGPAPHITVITRVGTN